MSEDAEKDSAWLSETLCALAEKHQVPGAQFAIHRGSHTVAVAGGETKHGSGDPVRRDTAFPIGSITKTFTAAGAMVLVADGRLTLDEPASECGPELGADPGARCPGSTGCPALRRTGGAG